MMFVRAVILLVLGTVAARADDGCHDLWFTRNLVMDQAGYCFGSVLGRAVFDNTGCTGKSVTIGPEEQRLVSRIRRLEQEFSCNVDTDQGFLKLGDASVRFILEDLPLRDEYESACIDWIGPDRPLRAGHSMTSAVIGTISTGVTLNFSHFYEGDWTYVTMHNESWDVIGGGWTNTPVEGMCRQYAG